MVDWSKAPEGAVDVRKGGSGNNFFTNGKDLYYDKKWIEMLFDCHDWPVVEVRPAVAPANKYDRVIHGKYGTGKCTVDVYRVLNAFGPLSPEIDHSIKKLLAAGQRGHKDEKQDLLEAIQSIEARLQYLEAVNG